MINHSQHSKPQVFNATFHSINGVCVGVFVDVYTCACVYVCTSVSVCVRVTHHIILLGR